jgi:hypothetical protein
VLSRADWAVALGESGEQHLQRLVPLAGIGGCTDVAAGIPGQPPGKRLRQRLEPREDAGAGRLITVQLVPEPDEERLVAPVAVLHGLEQLVAGQPARVPEGLAQFGLEGPHLVEIVARGERLELVKVVDLRVEVGCRDLDQRYERAIGMPLPVKRHCASPS